MERPNYFENLDGLRFLSAIGILLFHNYNNFEWVFFEQSPILYRICSFVSRSGLKAVNFFFVLSGFLITFLICKELRNVGTFNLKMFLLRRILRIWPLYFLVVAFGFIMLSQWDRLPLYLFFINNYDAIYHQEFLNAYLFPLWSIAVEEQFYILIPCIIFIAKIKNKNQLLLLFGFLLTISSIYLIFQRNNLNKLHYATWSCLTDISIGGIAAILSFYSVSFIQKLKSLNKTLLALIYLSGSIYVVTLVYIQNNWMISAERLILGLFFVFIILEQNYCDHSIIKISKFKFFSNSGKYSYSLYLTHMAVFTAVHSFFNWYPALDSLWIDIFLKLIISTILSFLLSMFLYNYLELPFLSLKNRFANSVV